MHILKSELDTFFSDMETALLADWSPSESSFHIQPLTDGFDVFIQKFIELATQNPILKEEDGTHSKSAAIFFHFQLVDFFKDFFLLWRDCIFETHRMLLFEQEGRCSLLQKLEHLENSKTVLQQALLDLRNFTDLSFQTFFTQKEKKQNQQLLQWEKRISPWLVYKKQFQVLTEQVHSLSVEHEVLSASSQIFMALKAQIIQHFEICNLEIGDVEKNLAEVIEYVKSTIIESPTKVAHHLYSVEKKLGSEHIGKRFMEVLDARIALLPSLKNIAVKVQEGQLVQKEIHLTELTKQWLDAEILPLLFEIWELTNNATNGMKMSLLNVGNRVSALAKDTSQTELETTDFTAPFEIFSRKEKTWKKELSRLENLVLARLNADFWLTHVFDATYHFLPISSNSLAQFNFEQTPWLNRIRDWWQHGFAYIQTFQRAVEHEESLSGAEKLLRYVQSRTSNVDYLAYSGIFLTKGFVGETFLVEREQELNRIKKSIENWGVGVLGAVLLSGTRLCGKTLFGEVVAQRYFPSTTIRLRPNESLEVNGRKFLATNDLGAALDFIKKHSIQTRPMVWIDDLELWADADLDISLGKNVRQLLQHITNNATRIFYVVSMGNALKAHLSKIYDLNTVFQSEISLDYMQKEDVLEAILIRHGATHKALVDNTGLVSPRHMRKLSNEVHNQARGNIGDALNVWSSAIQKVNEEEVQFELPYQFELPNSFTPDGLLLLAAIAIEKRTNEYRLRKLFGPAFSEKYSGILQRQLGNKVLLREFDGYLEINELVANDIGRHLERKKYLKYAHQNVKA